jgi:hypothetical protein
MAQTVCPLVSAEDRQRLAAVLAGRNRPQKHVARARIILHSAERLDVAEVARRAQISRPAVWRWQQRFAEAGVDGLVHDKTRKPGKPPTPEATVRRVVALTCGGERWHRSPRRGDALDRPDDGQGRRPVLADRPADLGDP